MVKKKAFVVAGVVGILLILLAKIGLGSSPRVPKISQQTNSDQVNLISTNPSPLDGATILPTQTIYLTFDQPAINAPYLYLKIDPEVDLDVELSGDRKTVKITPTKPYDLSHGYTIPIPTSAQFDGKKTLGHDVNFTFSTISYQGV